jgi:D-beta-D-heptose 7-phosphate kinase/D-beta-D-heptose 1-phosphate adenosyltransferase
MGKVVNLNELIIIRNDLRATNKKVVFTNGCFDILHKGHIDYLNKAKELGDVLIVGMNTDISVRQIKGPKRPIVPENERAYILSNLNAVDYVCMFNETTPINLISTILPDYLIKGADWGIDNVVGRQEVEKNGGKVLTIELTSNKSTTNIIQKILETYQL